MASKAVIRSLLKDVRASARTLDQHPWKKAVLVENSTVRLMVGGVPFFMMHRDIPSMRRVTINASSYFGKNIEEDELPELLEITFESLRAMKHAREEFDAYVPLDKSALPSLEQSNDELFILPVEKKEYWKETDSKLKAFTEMEGKDVTEEGIVNLISTLENDVRDEKDAEIYLEDCLLHALSKHAEVFHNEKVANKWVKELVNFLMPQAAFCLLASLRSRTSIHKELPIEANVLHNLASLLAQEGMTWAVLVLFHESPPGDGLWLLRWINLLIQSCAESHNVELGTELYNYVCEFLEPDEETLTSLAQLCYNTLRESEELSDTHASLIKDIIESIWAHPVRQDLTLPPEFYATVMGSSMDYDKCLQIYREMQSEGVRPNEDVVQALIESALRTGDMKSVSDAMLSGEKSGVSIDIQPIIESLKDEWEDSEFAFLAAEDDDDSRPDGF
mmetsp:Transcript_19639/g.27407  ORF Transcript_19639/g.27407 Transcript_19639/m.27407 type:complete len:448 (-) Transcript_19639:91-1434(-)|eukprot:CAMPEP_0184479042 /NCGR_PEP_ID=MMETSP0113_2-20130426/909_1 /TAXON_ID=91329 /ORGANISM="Norrisiella sphaerica, Strain BC52" /LENGTH=447 /DNA_ID=CAMNT_0026857031 /DNA_START=201 /DNA_END=1544 /DNA_ORIENTATION=-